MCPERTFIACTLFSIVDHSAHLVSTSQRNQNEIRVCRTSLRRAVQYRLHHVPPSALYSTASSKSPVSQDAEHA